LPIVAAQVNAVRNDSTAQRHPRPLSAARPRSQTWFSGLEPGSPDPEATQAGPAGVCRPPRPLQGYRV